MDPLIAVYRSLLVIKENVGGQITIDEAIAGIKDRIEASQEYKRLNDRIEELERERMSLMRAIARGKVDEDEGYRQLEALEAEQRDCIDRTLPRR